MIFTPVTIGTQLNPSHSTENSICMSKLLFSSFVRQIRMMTRYKRSYMRKVIFKILRINLTAWIYKNGPLRRIIHIFGVNVAGR